MSRRRWSTAAALALAACSSGGAAAPAPTSVAGSTAPPAVPAPATSAAPKLVTSGAPSVPTEPGRVPAEPADGCTDVPPTGPRTVTVWHQLGGDIAPAYLGAQVAEYEASHADVQVELVHPSGTPEEVIGRVAQLPVDQRPDVMLTPPGSARLLYDSGLFLQPADCSGGDVAEALAALLPAVQATFTIDGELWAAPYGVSVPMLMYDRQRWVRAGLDPDDPPETFDEMFAAIELLVASGEAATGIALYDRAASWLVAQTAARDGHLLIEPANGHDGVHIEAVEFEQPGAVELLERLHELKAEGKLSWLRANETGTADLVALVHPDTPSGMTLHTSASLGDSYALLAAADIDAEVGAAPLPGGSAPGASLGGGGWSLLDRHDPAQAAAAWQLVDWLVQPARIGGLAAATGYVPTSAAAAAAPAYVAAAAEHPELRTAYEIARASPTGDAAFIQVGPEPQVQRYLELAVAYPIDVGDDPTAKLREYEAAALEVLRLYESGQVDG